MAFDELAESINRKRAQRWSREDLVALWEKICAREEIDGWADGRALEYIVMRAFELEGARIRWPYGVTYPQKFGTMEQIDGLVYWAGHAFLMECKDFSEPAAIEAIAKLRFRLEGRPPGTMAVLLSARDFTLPTEVFAQFASPLNVLLWGRADLDIALRNKGLMTKALEMKLWYAIEEGLPLYPLGGDT
jgi:hypothetical protein